MCALMCEFESGIFSSLVECCILQKRFVGWDVGKGKESCFH